MDTVRFLTIELAKNVFQVHGVDAAGKLVLRRRIGRAQLTELVLRLTPCTIGMEACSSAHHWARQFQRQGHTVKLTSPQFVKPFVKGNKTGGNDAEAICEAPAATVNALCADKVLRTAGGTKPSPRS
ncbi:transposase family protein [Burkholderia pseudomallei]|nr:transposase family protein [Burkholderia pseudomallei]